MAEEERMLEDVEEEKPVDGKEVVLDESEGGPEPPADHPRFKQIYGRMKQYERDLASLRETVAAKDALVEEMKKHNVRLAQSIEKAVSARGEERGVEDKVASLESQIKALKSARKQALDDNDFDKSEDISDQIVDLKFQLREEQIRRSYEKQQVSQQISPEDNDILVQFTTENVWYQEDPVMAAAAERLDAILMRDPTWGRRPLKERLDEVKRRVEERFNYKPKSSPKGTYVEGATGSRSLKPKVVRLTPQQQIVAQGLGISDEDYARQVALIEEEG